MENTVWNTAECIIAKI